MTTIYTLDTLPGDITNPVVTIGNFDGVHKGHQAIFKKVIDRAADIGGTSLIITFEPHPLKVVSPQRLKPPITVLEHKRELVAELGIDILLVIEFTLEFAATSAGDFVRDILVERLGIREVVIGYDYVFGHNREGSIDILKEMGRQFNFVLHQIGPVYDGDTLVSSTSIRNLIIEGRMAEVNRLLGRHYQMRGKVIEGKKRGGPLLGYATANLHFTEGLIPKQGVYTVTLELGSKTYNGLTNIGYNPTFGDKTLSIETHIFDLSENILSQRIKINFLSRLRDEKAFTTPNELSTQIARDIRQAREFFRRNKPER
jgi:riboflavin kinase/FMN adenylyltransferase